MPHCLISFGANIGQPAETIQQAVQLLRTHLQDRLCQLSISRFFRTPAVGGPAAQPPFINAVAALELEDCSAWDMWHVVRKIEQQLGRVRVERWEARRIDLDVLLFDDQRIWTQHFKLPHPRLVMRRFILEPALDVASDWVEPVSRLSLSALAQRLRQGSASITLVARDMAQGQLLLERAARKSQSRWLAPGLVKDALASNSLDSGSGLESCLPNSTYGAAAASVTDRWQGPDRWLGLIAETYLESHSDRASDDGTNPIDKRVELVPPAKLVVLLASPLAAAGAAWEDYHRDRAQWLGLCPRSPSMPVPTNVPSSLGQLVWPLAGPRYLLSTDDLAWSEHEIVAALEAMDCPVEAISGF